MKFSTQMVLMAIIFLGLEPTEGDAAKQLDEALEGYGLDKDSFLNEPTMFALGYHRGLGGLPFDDACLPVGDDDKPVTALNIALEDAYAIALEARESRVAPPPSIVYSAYKAGKIKPGAFAGWLSTVDLSGHHRLSSAVTVGSGATARTIPAGTPVDVIDDGVIKDGVPHVVVVYDGAPLIIPNPADAPRIVSAATAVAPPAKEKKARAKKDSDSAAPTERKAPAERAPSLRDAIIYVIEGRDGGSGPLQSNGQFAGRVAARCRELGIGDKAQTFLVKADRHVPYYLNIYGPEFNGDGSLKEAGRLGVTTPLVRVCLAIRARKYYNRGDGLNHEQRMGNVPVEISAAIAAAGDKVYEVPKATTKTAPQATTETAPQATTETAPQATTETAPEATTETAPEATTETAPEV